MKNLKRIFMLALVVCFSFMLTACKNELDAGVNVNVGNETDYVLCTAQNSFVAKAQEIQMPTDINGIKLTFKANMTVNMGLMPTTAEVDFNMMLTGNMSDLEDIEDNLGMGLKGSVKVNDENSEISMYVKDGNIYVAMMDQKIKLPLDTIEDGMENSGSDLDDFDASILFEKLEDILTDENLVQKVKENGVDSTYLLELNGTKVYLVIKDGKFSQVLITMQALNVADLIEEFIPENEGLEIGAIEMLSSFAFSDVTLAMEFTDGSISYPSFNDYQDYSNGFMPWIQ